MVKVFGHGVRGCVCSFPLNRLSSHWGSCCRAGWRSWGSVVRASMRACPRLHQVRMPLYASA